MNKTMHTDLMSQVWQTQSAGEAAFKGALLVCVGVALLAVSAQFKVPFYPVPVTLQTLVVLLIAATYKPPLAVATVCSYLLVGAMGFPVFAAGGGLSYFMGPTGGFLLGFIPAVALASYLLARGWGASFIKMAAVLVLADALVFAIGFAYLGTLIGWTKAFVGGVQPFILADFAKVLIVAAGVTLAHNRINNKD